MLKILYNNVLVSMLGISLFSFVVYVSKNDDRWFSRVCLLIFIVGILYIGECIKDKK